MYYTNEINKLHVCLYFILKKYEKPKIFMYAHLFLVYAFSKTWSPPIHSLETVCILENEHFTCNIYNNYLLYFLINSNKTIPPYSNFGELWK